MRCAGSFAELQRRVLQVDEHPVVTRFWTFSSCVQTLLCVQLFDLLPIFEVATIKPQQEQQLRLTRVRQFFERDGTAADLRVACFCLQLTSYCTSLVAQQRREGAGAVLVKLARGEVQQKAGQMVSQQLLPRILDDAELPASRALEAILLTLGHLVGRFAQYQRYPTLLFRLCKKLNPMNWMSACVAFLGEEPLRHRVRAWFRVTWQAGPGQGVFRPQGSGAGRARECWSPTHSQSSRAGPTYRVSTIFSPLHADLSWD
jgi:hypothetical protein